jgi:nitrous oxidase accessory protein
MRHFLILLGVIIGTSVTNFSMAEVIDVCASCQIITISQAVTNAAAHDTIRVQSGTYFESMLEIDKPLVLLGIDKPVIDGQFKAGILEIKADSVTLSGFIIQNVGLSYTKDYAAVHLYRSDYFVLENNELSNVFFGMLIEKSHYGIVRNNVITSNAETEFSSGNGIHLWHCSNVSISGNRVSNLRDGIYLEFVTESQIQNNYSKDNLRYGLHFMFSDHDDYYDNEFINNGAGVAVMFSKNIEMTKNIFENNWGTASYGLLLKEIYDGEISGNLFTHNTIGIYAESANRLLIKDNDLKGNGWALKIMGSCMDNTFTQNNFFTNTFDLTTNSKAYHNSYS